jgi:hypothetical protein
MGMAVQPVAIAVVHWLGIEGVGAAEYPELAKAYGMAKDTAREIARMVMSFLFAVRLFIGSYLQDTRDNPTDLKALSRPLKEVSRSNEVGRHPL